MITIQSAMLVVLGFSMAGLLACVFAPVYRRRAARLATEALKRAMPLTGAEIAADKDRIRAEYAIRIHKLETNLSGLSLEAARQLVEINRRDARISALESDVARLGTINEEHENARRVLELTITERLPKVEQRLAEAKKLLFERDREIAALTQSSQRQALALDEATQINAQQRDDIHRLNATLTTRQARTRDLAEDQRHETEIALRTEIEALRARVRDQGDVIARLQSGEAGGSGSEMARLRESLSQAELALQAARGEGRADTKPAAARKAEIARLTTTVAEQSAEIARLSAALAARDAGAGPAADLRSGGQGPAALTERITALEAETAEQMSTILGLRAQIAVSNEKLAQQATFYMEEMRRLGAGTRPVGVPFSRSDEPALQPSAPPARPSLAERMNAPRVATVEISTPTDHGGASEANGHGGATAIAEAGEGADRPDRVDAGNPADAADGKPSSGRRQSLLQRITGLEKPVA